MFITSPLPASSVSAMLVSGAIQGFVLAVLAIALRRFTRHVMFAFLLVAALMYVVFAAAGSDSSGWLWIELAGLAAYGYLGWRGLRGSLLWLAAGWALHPIWDVALHFTGPGRYFAPVNYTVPCLTFDVAVGLALAWVAVREWQVHPGRVLASDVRTA